MTVLPHSVTYRSSRDFSREELSSLRSLLREGATREEAAKALGVPYGKVYYVCKKLSIPSFRTRKVGPPLFSQPWRAK